MPKRLIILCLIMTVLAYAVGCGGDGEAPGSDTASEVLTSDRTVKTPSTPWRFAVVGDTHVTAREAGIPSEITASILKDDARLVLAPGDLVKGGKGASSAQLQNQLMAWQTAMAPLYDAGVGVYPVRGNHEADVTDSASAWNAAFSGGKALPGNGPAGETGLTYSFTFRNAFFAGLDEYSPTHLVDQTWLDQQLRGSSSPHVFVFGHEPAFKVKHEDMLGSAPAERNAFWKSLTLAGGRTYFSGHDHFFDAIRIDDGDGDDANDLFQLIVGTGGGSIFTDYGYDGDNAPYTPVPLFHESQYGYLLVEISGESRDDLDVTMTWKQRVVDETSGSVSYAATADVIRYKAASVKMPSGASLVVDTGQTGTYGDSGEISPPLPGQPFYGQDSQFQGAAPAYRDNSDGSITDLITGLTWVKARGSKVSWADAVAGASTCRVGGFSDWRLPTVKELYSLIDFRGKSGPTAAQCIPYLDTRYFEWAAGGNGGMNAAPGERVIDGQDWSATEYVSTTMRGDETVFGVNFVDGRIKGYPKYKRGASGAGENTMFVRYVRGNPAYGVNRFSSNNDGTVTDDATGLMWSQADSGLGMNWQEALAWVQARNSERYLGHDDWRLPNAKELQSIVDYARAPNAADAAHRGPAIDPIFSSTAITDEGGNTDYPYYWSGTTHLDNDGGVYIAFGEALGWMQFPGSGTETLVDVHGAGAQRSDPKSGDPAGFPNGRGPQGDVVRIFNHVRLVRSEDQTG